MCIKHYLNILLAFFGISCGHNAKLKNNVVI